MLSPLTLLSQGSPGNLQDFEDILFVNNEMRDSTIIMAVKMGTENGTRVRKYLASAPSCSPPSLASPFRLPSSCSTLPHS